MELVSRAKQEGMEALALTDAGNLYGAIEFYQACVKEEITSRIAVSIRSIDRCCRFFFLHGSLSPVPYQKFFLSSPQQPAVMPRGARIIELLIPRWESSYTVDFSSIEVQARRS